jgi:multimeric flavodoxin WrbA
MKSLLIVYHSQSGASARLARAVHLGAREESEVCARLRRAWDSGVAELRGADGLILVAAENSGSLAGGMKDYLDRVFYPAIEASLVIPYALVLSAGNDGRGARRQVERILSGIPFTRATESIILRGEVTPAHLQAAGELGRAFAAGLAMGIF